MQGNFFTVITPDQNQPGRLLIKLGVVVKELGDSLVLRFHAKDYTFTNIIKADKLSNFAFFDTAAERQAFLLELVAGTTPKAEASPSESGPIGSPLPEDQAAALSE
jgi:hypothetical protein